MPMAETPHETTEAPEAMATGEADSEEDEARLPRTKKVPVGMTAAEWELHKLTHLPYDPACRCCVAGRNRRQNWTRKAAHRCAQSISSPRMLQERKE